MTDHDALHTAIAQAPAEDTAKLALADLLDEQGRPGAKLLREAARLKTANPTNGPLRSLVSTRPPFNSIISLNKPSTKVASQMIWPFQRADDRDLVGLNVTHYSDDFLPDTNRNYEVRKNIQYTVPVLSVAHLEHLTSDWPRETANELMERLRPVLPATHDNDPDRYSRHYAIAVTPNKANAH